MGSALTWNSPDTGVGDIGEYSVEKEYPELKDCSEPLRDEKLDAPADSAGVQM